jgi:inner membrane protein
VRELDEKPIPKNVGFAGSRNRIFRHLRSVDWITHVALGALIGDWMMRKRLGNWALAWGALFGIFPDFDVFLYPLLDTARRLAWHHGPSHSLLIIALGSYAIGRGLEKLWKQEKVSHAEAGWFIFIVWSSHVGLDCLTVEGADVLWPIADKRISLNLLHQIDFLFTAPLVIAAVSLALLREPLAKKSRTKKPAPPSKRRRIYYWGLGLSSAYLVLCAGMKYVASAGFDADLARRGKKYERRMEAPTPYNCLFWRAVVDRDHEFWVGYRSVFEKRDAPVRWTIYSKNESSLGSSATTREVKTLTRFTNGWWIARTNAKGAWLGDLRAPESRVWGSKKGMVDSRLILAWSIHPAVKSDRLRRIFPDQKNPSDYLQRLTQRIFGNHKDWEANPRLAGIAGSLPEFLAVEE